MKKILMALLSSFVLSSVSGAETIPFPAWVTMPDMKVMAVNKFMQIMENYPQIYYQLKNIQTTNSEDGSSQVVKVEIIFDTQTCKQRVFKGLFYSTLCKEQGCLIVTALDQCDSPSSTESKQ